MSTPKIDLIRQALSAAESSIKLARQLLGDLEKEGGRERPKAKELPGTAGIFDGQMMVTEQGETFPVPENYASKSILVVGDTLKLVEANGEKRFKQIEHVKRHKTTGILAKKDGKWTVVSSEGSYRVLPASISHFEGDVGDEVLLQLPANSLQTTWAAVEHITKKGSKQETKAISVGSQEIKQEKAPPEIKKEEKPREALTGSRQEPKAKEKEAVPVSGQEIKPKTEEVKVAPVAKGPEEKKEEPKEKPVAGLEEKTAPPEPRPAPKRDIKSELKIEPKPAAPEAKPAPPEPKPVPAESKPAPAEPKPTTEEMAEDELR